MKRTVPLPREETKDEEVSPKVDSVKFLRTSHAKLRTTSQINQSNILVKLERGPSNTIDDVSREEDLNVTHERIKNDLREQLNRQLTTDSFSFLQDIAAGLGSANNNSSSGSLDTDVQSQDSNPPGYIRNAVKAESLGSFGVNEVSLVLQNRLPVYHSYAKYRHWRSVISFSQTPPDAIGVRLYGNTRVRCSKKKLTNEKDAEGDADEYQDRFVDVTAIWQRDARDNTTYNGQAHKNLGLLKVRASKVQLSGNQIKLNLAVLLNNIALFPRHRGIPNNFNAEFICIFGSMGIRIKSPQLQILSKPHKRMGDLPQTFVKAYEAHSKQFDQM